MAFIHFWSKISTALNELIHTKATFTNMCNMVSQYKNCANSNTWKNCTSSDHINIPIKHKTYENLENSLKHDFFWVVYRWLCIGHKFENNRRFTHNPLNSKQYWRLSICNNFVWVSESETSSLVYSIPYFNIRDSEKDKIFTGGKDKKQYDSFQHFNQVHGQGNCDVRQFSLVETYNQLRSVSEAPLKSDAVRVFGRAKKWWKL